jgi:hypothetical protein
VKSHSGTLAFLITVLLITALVSCTSAKSSSIPLASFTENDVNVSISLAGTPDGNYAISATFTPPDGYHLYSKDIPAQGIKGLGRPTLLELPSGSLLKTAGPLTESVKPQKPDFEPRELLVYPRGPVRLSLPVELPAGSDWLDDKLSVTYMACSASQCKPPVVGKIVPIRVPGAGTNDIQ